MLSTEVKDGKGSVTVGDFVWQTWAEVQGHIDAVGSAMAHLGLVKANDLGVSGSGPSSHRCKRQRRRGL